MYNLRKRLLLSLTVLLVAAGLEAQTSSVPVSLQSATWKAHLEKDLIPFWTMPEALGQPVGNFPTIRTMDGKTNAETRRLPRMLGRQVFFYCAAYLMTGQVQLLEYAKAGTDWIIDHAWDNENQGWYAELNQDGTPAGHKTKYTQDMAYTAMGLAAYFFVTRDARAETYLKKTRDLIFDPATFWDAQNARVKDGLDFFLKKEKDQEGGGWELVALLDQINAYMLLTQPVLSQAADRQLWAQDLTTLGQSIVKYFYKDGIFWGQRDKVGRGGRHVDFGHTFKSYWMLSLIDQHLGTHNFTELFDQQVPAWLNLSFDKDNGLWANNMTSATTVNYGPAWWIFAESDQIAASLNLKQRNLTPILERTAAGWLKYFVDHRYGEVYSDIRRDGSPGSNWDVTSTSKVWDWKNGFHSAEHALIMYIHGLVLENQPVTLFFAPEVPEGFSATPYVYTGKELSRKNWGPVSVGDKKLTKLSISYQLN